MAVGKKGVNSNINITPYIDILLVLLIIFMTTAPMKPKDHLIKLPKPAISTAKPIAPTIVEMSIDHKIKLDERVYTPQELETELTKRFNQPGAIRNMFVRGDGDLSYGDIFLLLDIAHRSGAQDIALLDKNASKRAALDSPADSSKGSH
jgi:biopolymer transport protein ExbD